MNRLWVRLSLTFFGIIVFVIVLPLTVGISIRTFGPDESYFSRRFGVFSSGNAEEFLHNLDSPDEIGSPEVLVVRRLPGRFVLGNIFATLLVLSSAALLAGIFISRGLTAPLNQLAEAARAIGSKELTQRVDVGGSKEIRTVATAFNDMAVALENAEQLRSNLLADVAHELRTPLTVVQGNLRAILDGVYELDKEEIARLYEQTRHLARLVDDLHELAQAEAQQLSLDIASIDVGELIRESAAAFDSMISDEGVSLQVEIEDNLPFLFADRARLVQGIHNLLSNALRFTPAGGSIRVKGIRDSGCVSIAVSDTGVGIDPQHVAHVFDRFYRSDEARSRDSGGSGLGLAIVKAIVEAQGGNVKAESAGMGKGSTFTIWMPGSDSD